MSARDERVERLTAWFAENLTFENFGHWSNEDFARAVLAALADDPAQAEGAAVNYELAFYRANEACSVREAALARVEAVLPVCEYSPDEGATSCENWAYKNAFEWCLPCRIRAALAGGPTEGSEQ